MTKFGSHLDRVGRFAKSRRPKWTVRSASADARAALVLGIESVPDGLANGLLAGLNPVAGLYAYMVGVSTAALVTSAPFMAVQGTGAMAIIVADSNISSFDDPTRALVTLSLLTGLVMTVAGLAGAGAILRFVPNSVMTGFITAVGINIVLSQVSDFTGYESSVDGRVASTLDTLFHFWLVDWATVVVGVVTIVLIVVLRRTRLQAMGLVLAIVAGSALGALLGALDHDVASVGDIAAVPNSLPGAVLPSSEGLIELMVPAVSLAFVGLIQGAAISAGVGTPDDESSDQSRDFVGQGLGNVAAGLFQGMPVGGSTSASSLIVSAGAKTRLALILTGGVMAVVILLFAGAVERIAMPALAGLLMVVGIETVRPHEVAGVFKTGTVPATVLTVTLVLTLLVPLQFAVLVGVGIATILHVTRQSNQLTIRRLIITDEGRIRETEPPATVEPADVVVLQPYGSLFFASAPSFEEQLPEVDDASQRSVVILRLRGKPDVGSTLIDVLRRYAEALNRVGSKLAIVTDSDRILDQLAKTGTAEVVGHDNLYRSSRWLSETVKQATVDAWIWVESGAESPG